MADSNNRTVTINREFFQLLIIIMVGMVFLNVIVITSLTYFDDKVRFNPTSWYVQQKMIEDQEGTLIQPNSDLQWRLVEQGATLASLFGTPLPSGTPWQVSPTPLEGQQAYFISLQGTVNAQERLIFEMFGTPTITPTPTATTTSTATAQ